MPFLFRCYNSSPFFCFEIKKDKIYMMNHTARDLKFVSINNVTIIYNIKWPTQMHSYHALSIFSLHMQLW
jgi:hypothetical protein